MTMTTDAKMWVAMAKAFTSAMDVVRWYVERLNGDPDDDVSDDEQQELLDETMDALATVNAIRLRFAREAKRLMDDHAPGAPMYEVCYQAFDTADIEIANGPEVDGTSPIIVRGGELETTYYEVEILLAEDGE
jgi:hypothetical protein